MALPPGYTGVYAAYHGILGHTVEIPEGNQSPISWIYITMSLEVSLPVPRSNSSWCASTSISVASTRVEDPKAENELVGPNGKVVSRIKHGQRNSSWLLYVIIPIRTANPMTLNKPFNMIEYFKRNGVRHSKIEGRNADSQTLWFIKEEQFGCLAFVAKMAVAYANHILYKGSNSESAWAAMYAELVR